MKDWMFWAVLAAAVVVVPTSCRMVFNGTSFEVLWDAKREVSEMLRGGRGEQ